ncbi:hypothetical protein [Bacillus sp. ISL-55]|uniref:hypothetical protein n=1 Tax=Bacillus sp. ISL-55 TaxID=2819134 RepID=UPI001BE4EA88|nr:hypothetical protein [Bacillus sp. ISL-55]MBT2695782.1 hypothetical protein [Bacillus sp. ISL-55]
MEKLSEVSPCSDRIQFEQGEVCPKYRHVRTGYSLNKQKLSEVSPCSDRLQLEQAKAVRSIPVFGQVTVGTSKSCPKYPRVRTGFRLNKQKLSEVGPCSDRFRSEQGKAVRSIAMFGQVTVGTSKSCPK